MTTSANARKGRRNLLLLAALFLGPLLAAWLLYFGADGWRPGGETHFNVTVVAGAFDGKSRVERQRMVYEILADEMAGPVHALALSTKTPAEA